MIAAKRTSAAIVGSMEYKKIKVKDREDGAVLPAADKQVRMLTAEEIPVSGAQVVVPVLTQGAAVLQGDASDEQTPEGTEVSVALDGEAMDRFARIIASDADLSQTTFRDGSVTLVLQGDTLTQLTVKCSGTVRIVRRDVAANLSALFRFDAPGPFPVLSEAVETALGLQ